MMPLKQPPGTTPGPWYVVPDPWDRSGLQIVGDNDGRGPTADPHVSPPVGTTDAVIGCMRCEEGEHDEGIHRADARLAAASPQLYDLVLRRLRVIAEVAARDGHDLDGWMSEDGKWARAAAHTIADALPQRMEQRDGAWVYPRDSPVRRILELADPEPPAPTTCRECVRMLKGFPLPDMEIGVCSACVVEVHWGRRPDEETFHAWREQGGANDPKTLCGQATPLGADMYEGEDETPPTTGRPRRT